MSNKKETEEPGLTTEEAKELELDEQPKPTRKTTHHSPPMSYNEEPGRHHKRKGTRKMKQQEISSPPWQQLTHLPNTKP